MLLTYWSTDSVGDPRLRLEKCLAEVVSDSDDAML
jgi:hypothetical protein